MSHPPLEHLNKECSSRRFGVRAWGRVSVAALFFSAALTTLPTLAAPQGQSGIPVADYMARLQSLDRLVAACRKDMIPANCQGDQVGPDFEVSLPSGTRQVRLAWLRETLNRAGKYQAEIQVAKDKAAKAQASQPYSVQQSKTPPTAVPAADPHDYRPPTRVQQLEDARSRLAADARLAAQEIPPTSPQMQAEHQALARILSAKEYHPAVVGPTLLQRALEKIGNWIDRGIGALQRAGFRSKWIGRTAEIGFVLLLCIGLGWFLIRLERQGRMRAGFLPEGTGVDIPSARDWQLWLKEARDAASQGAWRDAIHLLYWASISRLESSGAWAADRARTPREYLTLISPDSAERSGLVSLTRTFERTWYGGRTAAEADFRAAEQLVADLRLGVEPGARSPNVRTSLRKATR